MTFENILVKVYTNKLSCSENLYDKPIKQKMHSCNLYHTQIFQSHQLKQI